MIPITFNKDDLNNVKKGNVRGQDLASFLSISMPKRAGILDIFDDPCGYVQIVPSTGYATITMKKGYVNIYGRCIYVEQGEQVQIALPASGTVTGTFGIRVDLGETGANEVAWFTKTTTLQQDNILNNEITGIYEFALYNYTATSSGLTLTKIATVIQNIDDYLKGANFETLNVNDSSNKIATTEFVRNNISRQTKFKTINATADVKAESTTIGTSVNFSGSGIQFYDDEQQKTYWQGNLMATFQYTATLADVENFKLENFAMSGLTLSSIKNAGIFIARTPTWSYSNESEKIFIGIPQNTSSFTYIMVDTGYDIPNIGGPMTISLTNVILEI